MKEALQRLDPETLAFKIICYMTFKDAPLKPVQIARALDEKGSSVRARLAELKAGGLVDSTSEGYVARTTSYDVLMKIYRAQTEP